MLRRVVRPYPSERRVSSAPGPGLECVPCDLGLMLGSAGPGGQAAARVGGVVGERFLGTAACRESGHQCLSPGCVRKSGLRCDAEQCTGACPGTEERREPPLSAAEFPGNWRKFGSAGEVAQDSIV